MAQINMPESNKYPPNNRLTRDRLEPVVMERPNKPAKRSLFDRIFNDAPVESSDIFDSVMRNVVGPKMKDLTYNTIVSIAQMLIYKGQGPVNYNPNGLPVNTQRVGYSSVSGQRPSNRFNTVDNDTRVRDWRAYNEFDFGADAENVLAAMRRRIAQRGSVSIGDLCDLTRVRNFDFTLDSWGWYDLPPEVTVRYELGKFRITFPEAVYLGDR